MTHRGSGEQWSGKFEIQDNLQRPRNHREDCEEMYIKPLPLNSGSANLVITLLVS